VVQRARSGQPWQRAPKTAVRVRVIRAVSPFGQVTMAAASSTVNSSIVNPPSTAGRSGHGLMIAVCPPSATAASSSPVP
jgi:hypothetical protein